MSKSALHLRLFVAFALVALLSSLSSALVVMVVTGQRSEDEAVLRLHSAANIVLALVEVEKDRDLSDAAELAARLGMQRELEQATIERTIAGSRQRIRDDFLAVVDGTGQLVAEDSLAPGLGVGATEAIRLALAGRSVALVAFDDKALRIEAAAPIQRDGAVVGGVVAGDLVDSRFLGQIKRSTGLEAALLNDGRLLASTLEEPRSEMEQGLVAALHAGNAAERIEAGEQVVTSPRVGERGYMGLLVPLAGIGGRTVAVLFLGMPASQLSARQLELLLPLLGLLSVALLLVAGVGFLVARAMADRLVPPIAEQATDRIRLDGLEIDWARHEAALRGRPLSLTPTEFKLLWVLARSPGRVFTRQELMEQLWGTDFAPESGVVDTHIGNLRRKIEADPAKPEYILTVRGVGFKFRPPAP